jgi:mono/diheme cytochrome c family protein
MGVRHPSPVHGTTEENMGTKIATSLVVGMLLVPAIARAQGPDGAALYREQCRSCHGVVGNPPARARDEYPNIPSLADSAFMARLSEDSIVTVLRRGKGEDMRPFTSKLSAEEMRAVARFVRALPSRRR